MEFQKGTIGLSRQSKRLFQPGLDAITSRSLLDMRAWLNSVRCARKNLIRQVAVQDRMYNQLRLSMARFLHRQHPPLSQVVEETQEAE